MEVIVMPWMVPEARSDFRTVSPRPPTFECGEPEPQCAELEDDDEPEMPELCGGRDFGIVRLDGREYARCRDCGKLHPLSEILGQH